MNSRRMQSIAWSLILGLTIVAGLKGLRRYGARPIAQSSTNARPVAFQADAHKRPHTAETDASHPRHDVSATAGPALRATPQQFHRVTFVANVVDWRTLYPVADFKVLDLQGLAVPRLMDSRVPGRLIVDCQSVDLLSFVIEAPGYAPLRVKQAIRASEITTETSSAKEVTSTFRLAPYATVTGRVLDMATSRPLAGVSVRALDESTSPAITANDGTFRLTNIARALGHSKSSPRRRTSERICPFGVAAV